jgi:menaquinone-specific isochorismate synthase
VLHAVTRPLAHVPGDLFAYADPHSPLVWTRGDRGCAGSGEVLRLTFSGPGRFEDAARVWRDIASTAVVDDPVRMPGSGLIAFGTFAFADDSAAESVLIVPRLVVSRHRGIAWVTEVSTRPIDHDPEPSQPELLGDWVGVDLPVADPDETYLAGVREAAARIERGGGAEGAVEKIVLARRVEGRIAASDDLRVPLERLAARYEDCWTYAVDGMLGASPETLVRQTDGAISARVLAGTRGRKPHDPEADARARDELLMSAKEQHEHDFAVQSVVTALAPHVRDLRTSEQPFALELPNVWHLATDLGAVPGDDGSSLELAASLHPTAAVAGTPTAAAVRAISELEPFDRERYAGAIGWIDAAGEGEWVIALRCAQLGPGPGVGSESTAERTITAYAGGGIVEGSDPRREFTETVSKFAPIAEAFSA